MEFIISYKEEFSLVAVSYESGYSSLYECERLFIRLKEYSDYFESDLIRLYDMGTDGRNQMIADIEQTRHLALENYYNKDCKDFY
ncbi:hypothetical protein [Streptococcus suis]|uniref:hypothetical protein n=1 Tax=Streptococcus suis TaxID=1307 RepID=UPI001ABE6F44|nr:hypothetical protein [Streptococcus suis]